VFIQVNGKSSYLLGVNYWPTSSAIQMWTDWQSEELTSDVRRMKELGLNTCRFFLFMPTFLAVPDRLQSKPLKRLHEFLSICETHQLYTLPSFIVGHMSGEDWDLSWSKGRNFITDPELVKAQQFYIGEIVKATKNYQYILGWILSNEIPNYIGLQSASEVTQWAAKIIRTIKAIDPNRPVSIGDGAWSPEILGEQTGFHLRKLNQYQDFVGLHYYPRGISPWHHTYTTAFRITLAKEWSKRVIVEEFGTSTTLCSEENQAHYYRSVLFSSLINGAEGALSWCLNDFDTEHMRPYSHHAFEEHFGIIRTDGTSKPAALEFRKFKTLYDVLSKENCRAVKYPAGLLIPSDYYYSYPYLFEPRMKSQYDFYLETFSLLKRANIDLRAVFEPAQELEKAGEYTHLIELNPSKLPLLFAPRLKFLTKPFIKKLFAYVRSGGTLYFSFANDSWVSDWQILAGIKMDCKFGVPDFSPIDTLTIGTYHDWGDFDATEQLQMPIRSDNPEFAFCPIISHDAEILLTESTGKPFLLKHQFGKGSVYFCPYPIEMLSLYSSEDHWKTLIRKIYSSIYRNKFPQKTFHLQGDGLEMGVWQADQKDHYYLIIQNHSWESNIGTLSWQHSERKLKTINQAFTRISQNELQIEIERKEMCFIEFI
jgi:hypothetical protein